RRAAGADRERDVGHVDQREPALQLGRVCRFEGRAHERDAPARDRVGASPDRGERDRARVVRDRDDGARLRRGGAAREGGAPDAARSARRAARAADGAPVLDVVRVELRDGHDGLRRRRLDGVVKAAAATAAARRAPAIRRALLRWFDAHRRDLPWRRDRDPYRIWVSEVMLQQTRIDVVVPAYERFVAAFPDVGSLAAASEDDVLSLWS